METTSSNESIHLIFSKCKVGDISRGTVIHSMIKFTGYYKQAKMEISTYNK